MLLVSDVKRYINTITGECYDAQPPEFRGGLLADSMGLGKSLSMLSLITANQCGDTEDIPTNPNTVAVKTTLLVVPFTCKSPAH